MTSRLKSLWSALLAVLLASAALAHAAPSCPPEMAKPTTADFEKAMAVAADHGFLWRITKDGHTSYLYGTMHINKLDWLYLGPTIGDALHSADTVALEMDLLDPKIRSDMKTAMANDHGAKLPPELQERIRKQAAALCVPYEKLAQLSPEMQVAGLSMLIGRWIGLDPAYAVDAFLAAVAHGAHKQVVSLETPEFQLKMIKMKTPEDTVESVKSDLDDLESGKALKLIKKLSEAWAHSDYATMEKFDDWCDCLNTPAERDEEKRMLDMRNPGMAERIDALHKSGKSVFAAVGSAHMFGPKGLPALMKQRGYTVERVPLHGRTVKSANQTELKGIGDDNTGQEDGGGDEQPASKADVRAAGRAAGGH